jgi:hypothetical protein
MDFELAWGPEPDRLTIVVSGVATLDGFRRMIDEGIADERFRPPMRALLDYSDLDMSGLSGDDMRLVAAHASEQPEKLRGARVAVVAPRALAYGLTRVAASTMDLEETAVQVFGVRADAEAWLDA